MKRLGIIILLLAILTGCKKKNPVNPYNNNNSTDTTQGITQGNSTNIPLVGDTIGIKIDSCVKVLDTLTMDTLTICWDSVVDKRLLYPLCTHAMPWGYAKVYYTLNGNIHFMLGMEDCNVYAKGCGGLTTEPYLNRLPMSIDTLGYEICLTYFWPPEDTFSQPGIPDSAYFSKLYIHKK